MDHAHQFNVVVYGDGDVGQYIGIISIFVLDISQMLQHLLSIPCHKEAVSAGTLEEYIGVEPTSSAWRAEVLTVIRILHKIAGEPSLSPAMMLVLEVVNPEHHLYTL